MVLKALFVGHAPPDPGAGRARQPRARRDAPRLRPRALGGAPPGHARALARHWPFRRRRGARRPRAGARRGGPREREGAALALADCPAPEAKALLATAPATRGRHRPGALTWTALGRQARRSGETMYIDPAHPHDLAHDRRLRGDGARPASSPASSRRSGSASRGPTSAPTSTICRRSAASSGSAPASSASATTAPSGSTARRPTTRRWPRQSWRSCRASPSRRASSPSARSATTSRRRSRTDTSACSSSSPRSSSCRSWSTPRIATRARDVALDGRLAEHGLDPALGGHRPQQRGDGERRARPRLLGGVLDLSAHQDGQRAHDRDRAPATAPSASSRLGLRLGRLRSARGAEDGGADAPRAASPRARSARSPTTTRSPPTARAARCSEADWLDPPPIDQRTLYAGNSVLRGGQEPRIEAQKRDVSDLSIE